MRQVMKFLRHHLSARPLDAGKGEVGQPTHNEFARMEMNLHHDFAICHQVMTARGMCRVRNAKSLPSQTRSGTGSIVRRAASSPVAMHERWSSPSADAVDFAGCID